MRILLSAYACRPNAGSEPGYGWNWATHLAARGIEVHVLANHRNQTLIQAELRDRPVDNLQFTFVRGSSKFATKSEGLHYSWWQVKALSVAKKLNQVRPFDLVHHVTYGSVHVPSQLWRLRIPVVFGPVGGGQTAPESMFGYFGSSKISERIRTAFTRALKLSPIHRAWLRRMSFILTANHDTMNLVGALGCTNTKLMCDAGLPNSYFTSGPRHFGESDEALKLLWVGRMLPRKALPLALDTLKEVKKNVTMTIAGDGIDPQKVHKMIRDRNLEDRVFWKGTRLSWNELRTAYMEHDAMLFTSLRDSFGSQMLEAMATGLPIIALDLHGACDFVPEGASLKAKVVTPEETVRNLTDAIEKYASFPSTIKNQMSKHAWNFARTLSWSARAEAVEKIYREVLGRTPALESAPASDFIALGTQQLQ